MDSEKQRLTEYLENLVKLKKTIAYMEGAVYYGMEDFLLQHGTWYEPTPYTWDFPQGAPKSCYGNALLLGITDRLRYIEGIAVTPHIPIGVHHAWNVTSDGTLVDNTWLNTGTAYLGVEFSVGRAEEAIWFDDGTVLDNMKRRYDLYMRPWKGENFGKEWKRSKLMDQLRINTALNSRPRRRS